MKNARVVAACLGHPRTYGIAGSRAALKAAMLDTVGKAIDEKLAHLSPGQGLGIVFALPVIKKDGRIEGQEEDRNSTAYSAWRKAVIAEAGSRCQHPGCEATEDLHAHHVEPWALAPERRFDITNGRALCRRHHAEQHPERAALILSLGYGSTPTEAEAEK